MSQSGSKDGQSFAATVGTERKRKLLERERSSKLNHCRWGRQVLKPPDLRKPAAISRSRKSFSQVTAPCRRYNFPSLSLKHCNRIRSSRRYSNREIFVPHSSAESGAPVSCSSGGNSKLSLSPFGIELQSIGHVQSSKQFKPAVVYPNELNAISTKMLSSPIN